MKIFLRGVGISLVIAFAVVGLFFVIAFACGFYPSSLLNNAQESVVVVQEEVDDRYTIKASCMLDDAPVPAPGFVYFREDGKPTGELKAEKGETVLLRYNAPKGYEFDHYSYTIYDESGAVRSRGNGCPVSDPEGMIAFKVKADEEFVIHFKSVEDDDYLIPPLNPDYLVFSDFEEAFDYYWHKVYPEELTVIIKSEDGSIRCPTFGPACG